ncbi:MAG TPA: hypothetical protein VJ885_17805 [Thermoanaerobaculia bacterium]|nr:hypothetical protein [Thermoanaerobaculia bacterium]
MSKNVSHIVATLLVLGTLTVGTTQASAAEGKVGGPELSSLWSWLSSWVQDAGLITPWEGSQMDPDGRPQSTDPDEGSSMDPDGAQSGDEGSGMDPDGLVDEGSGMNPNG